MTVQDIRMGFDAKTGRQIMFTDHEQTFIEFCEYRGIDPHAWKKSDQIGYYRALQEDWETARDDDMDPPVVDHLDDLPAEVLDALEARSREDARYYQQIVGLARHRLTWDARNIYDASQLTYARYLEALADGEKLRARDQLA